MTNLALFSDYTFLIVSIGSGLLGAISAFLGCFALLRKQSLLGDGISHAALPGVVLAFILTGSKNSLTLMFGAMVAGVLATVFILGIVKATSIKFDSALALILSVFFGGGIVLLTYIQKLPNANQAGLDRFIYGQVAGMLLSDLVLIACCSVVLMALVLLFWKEFKLICFDFEFAKTIGLPAEKLSLVLSFMIVVSIIIGLQTVGVILMSAMLIAPAVGARQWTDKFWVMASLASIFGAFSGVAGTIVSSIVPTLPTGPVIVVCVTLIACFSLLFAPKRGILSKLIKRRKHHFELTAGRRG